MGIENFNLPYSIGLAPFQARRVTLFDFKITIKPEIPAIVRIRRALIKSGITLIAVLLQITKTKI